MTNYISAYPLTWPDGWSRPAQPMESRFGDGWKNQPSVSKGTDAVLDELRKLGIDRENIIISTNLTLRLDGLPRANQKMPIDSAAAVWWTQNGEQKVMAIGQYCKVGCNLWAIAKTLETMRGIQRWGGGEILERTFTGFTALPHFSEPSPWRQLFDYHGNDLKEAEAIFKQLRSKSHPDKGGDADFFKMVVESWEAAKLELGQ